MRTEKSGLELFGEYGVAWRKKKTLNLNQFGKSVGLGTNTFVGMVERMEEECGKWLVPRTILELDSKKHTDEIADSSSEALDADRNPRDAVRVAGLTPFGHSITDYFVLKGTMDALYELLLERRELPPPVTTKFFSGGSMTFGGDTPERRGNLANACGAFLAKHAPEFAIVGEGLKSHPSAPAAILERHAEAMAYVPEAMAYVPMDPRDH